MVDGTKVALLVDADNISAMFAGQIIRKTENLGTLCIRQAFCNAGSLVSWSSAPSFRTIHAGEGKNGADILLSIQAMEYALRDRISTFAIATSDGDLSHVAHRLRELGCLVVGFGEEKAPKAFQLACNRFEKLVLPQVKVADAKLGKVDRIVRMVLQKYDATGKGIALARLNGLVRKEDSTIRISTLPEKNWPTYLREREGLYSLIGDGENRRVTVAAQTDDG